MKTPEQIKKDETIFTQIEKERVDLLVELLLELKKKETVSFEGLRSLDSIEREVWTLRSNYVQKVMNLLKRGHIL